MKKVIAVTLSLVFLWFVSSPQSVYADTNNKLKTKPINIAFCFNENLWMQAGVTITSLLCTAEEKCCYNIYCVVPDSVNQTMRNILESLVKKRSPMSSIKFFTVTNQLNTAQLDAANIGATYYRLLLPKLLPDADKVIYTDIDVIFNDDLQEMDKIDISKYYVAGVKDLLNGDYLKNDFLKEQGSKIWRQYGLFDIYDKRQYINAGVLILNLKKIRQDGIDKRWLELINIGFRYSDQDIINTSCAGNKLLLSDDYNYIGKNSKILHYVGWDKPWQVCNLTDKPKYDELWWYYAEKTPFSNYFMKNATQKQLDYKFKVLPKWLSKVFCWFIPKKEASDKFREKYMAEY